MSSRYLFIFISMATLLCSPVQADNKFDEISAAVQKYLDGTSMGQPDLVTEAFLPSLEVQWLSDDGKLLRRPGPEYISRIEKNKSVPREGRIISIDTTDRSAAVKVEIEWNNRLYTDYMLMLKVEGHWKIANKIASWKQLD